MVNRPTHIEISEPSPGDGEEVSMQDARQATRPGFRLLAVLIVSLAAATLLLGVYWLALAPKLQRADTAAGAQYGQAVSPPSSGRTPG